MLAAVRILLAIALAVILAACGQTRIASRDVRFDATSEMAVVVVGLSPSAIRAGSLGKNYGSEFSLNWLRHPDRHSFFQVPLTGGRDATDYGYTVHIVEPGTYVLASLTYVSRLAPILMRTRVTKFTEDDAVYGFTVQRGEIAYIGNFLAYADSLPASIYRGDPNEAAARKELARFKGIVGQMQLRRARLYDVHTLRPIEEQIE